mmetsp:Transcript_11434/g.70238  ORF Transcript_11434/g.70238 Transcript_11434/m.70238 type:complete len:158 (+) Transcript_11434:1451-1924(+)
MRGLCTWLLSYCAFKYTQCLLDTKMPPSVVPDAFLLMLSSSLCIHPQWQRRMTTILNLLNELSVFSTFLARLLSLHWLNSRTRNQIMERRTHLLKFILHPRGFTVSSFQFVDIGHAPLLRMKCKKDETSQARNQSPYVACDEYCCVQVACTPVRKVR